MPYPSTGRRWRRDPSSPKVVRPRLHGLDHQLSQAKRPKLGDGPQPGLQPGSMTNWLYAKGGDFLLISGRVWNLKPLARHLGVRLAGPYWPFLLCAAPEPNRPARCDKWGQPGHRNASDSAHRLHGRMQDWDALAAKFSRPIAADETARPELRRPPQAESLGKYTNTQHEAPKAETPGPSSGSPGRGKGKGRGKGARPATARGGHSADFMLDYPTWEFAEGSTRGYTEDGRGEGEGEDAIPGELELDDLDACFSDGEQGNEVPSPM